MPLLTIVQNKSFCTYGQIVAPWDSLVRTSYLHWIVSLIPFLQGGLENTPWSLRTFPLTELHTLLHMRAVACWWRVCYQQSLAYPIKFFLAINNSPATIYSFDLRCLIGQYSSKDLSMSGYGLIYLIPMKFVTLPNRLKLNISIHQKTFMLLFNLLLLSIWQFLELCTWASWNSCIYNPVLIMLITAIFVDVVVCSSN